MVSIWRQKTNKFRVSEAWELCLTIHLGEGDSDLQPPLPCGSSLAKLRLVLVSR